MLLGKTHLIVFYNLKFKKINKKLQLFVCAADFVVV